MNYYVQDKYEYDEALLDCGVIFILSTVSASYYNWANYHWQIEGGMIGDLADIGLSDPVWGYSNVSTGAGVIAAESVASYSISFKDFLKNLLPPN